MTGLLTPTGNIFHISNIEARNLAAFFWIQSNAATTTTTTNNCDCTTRTDLRRGTGFVSSDSIEWEWRTHYCHEPVSPLGVVYSNGYRDAGNKTFLVRTGVCSLDSSDLLRFPFVYDRCIKKDTRYQVSSWLKSRGRGEK